MALVGATVVAVLVATAGVASAAPLVTITPNTGLQDGQVVQVHAEGYPAGDTVQINECGPNSACRTLQTATITGAGTLDLPVVAHAQIRPAHGSSQSFLPTDCNGGCNLGVLDSPANIAEGGPLTFVDGVTILEGATATPASGLHDGQSVHVHVQAGYFDLGQGVYVLNCELPYNPAAPVCAGVTGAPGLANSPFSTHASSTDASVDASIVVRDPLAVPDPAQPPINCATTPCGVVVTGQFNDDADATITFVAVTVTTAPATTIAPVTAQPAFTG
jgi:hypothetical protein